MRSALQVVSGATVTVAIAFYFVVVQIRSSLTGTENWWPYWWLGVVAGVAGIAALLWLYLQLRPERTHAQVAERDSIRATRLVQKANYLRARSSPPQFELTTDGRTAGTVPTSRASEFLYEAELSPTELNVSRLLLQDMSQREIGKTLSLSEGVVAEYVRLVRQKMARAERAAARASVTSKSGSRNDLVYAQGMPLDNLDPSGDLVPSEGVPPSPRVVSQTSWGEIVASRQSAGQYRVTRSGDGSFIGMVRRVEHGWQAEMRGTRFSPKHSIPEAMDCFVLGDD